MKLSRSLLIVLASVLAMPLASADITVSNARTTTAAPNNETLTVTSTGSITTSNSRTVDLVGTVTVNNNGTIRNNGTGEDNRGVQSRNTNVTLTLNNHGLIQTQNGDTVRMGTQANNTGHIYNYGSIISVNVNREGNQAIDLAGITTNPNSLTNYSTGLIRATAADAVRMGRNAIIDNAGTIEALPVTETGGTVSGSDGIDAQGNYGQQITNSGIISGRHGITGGNDDNGQVADFTMTITNNSGGTITGVNGSGVNIDGSMVAGDYSSVTVTNYGTITGSYDTQYTEGDGDGVDVDGQLSLDNHGIIRGLGASGTVGANTNNSEGVAMGGGTVINRAGAEITGENTSGTDGGGNGILVDDSNGGNAIAATTVTNSGLIEGRDGFGIKIVGTFADTVTNESTGIIRGTGTTAGAALQTGGGGDTVTNRGTITGSNGAAVDLGDGTDTLIIEGGSAVITGSSTGGNGTDTLIIAAGTGNTFTTSGTFTSFESVQLQSGTTVLQGANRIGSDSALTLGDATLKFESIAAANGQTFSDLTITGDATIDLGGTTSLTFLDFDDLTAGSSLSVIGYDQSLSPAYALRFSGDWLSDVNFADFLGNLTINGGQAFAAYDGTYTTLSVPEPSSAALILLAGAALAARRRMKKAA